MWSVLDNRPWRRKRLGTDKWFTKSLKFKKKTVNRTFLKGTNSKFVGSFLHFFPLTRLGSPRWSKYSRKWQNLKYCMFFA